MLRFKAWILHAVQRRGVLPPEENSVDSRHRAACCHPRISRGPLQVVVDHKDKKGGDIGADSALVS